MNKLRQIINSYRNNGTDPRKNDAWRILLFSLNYAGGAAITIMMGKWSYYTQNVLQPGIMFASIHLPIRILDAVTVDSGKNRLVLDFKNAKRYLQNISD